MGLWSNRWTQLINVSTDSFYLRIGILGSQLGNMFDLGNGESEIREHCASKILRPLRTRSSSLASIYECDERITGSVQVGSNRNFVKVYINQRGKRCDDHETKRRCQPRSFLASNNYIKTVDPRVMTILPMHTSAFCCAPRPRSIIYAARSDSPTLPSQLSPDDQA